MLTTKTKKALCLTIFASLSILSLNAADSHESNTTHNGKYTTKHLIFAGAAGIALGAVGAFCLYKFLPEPPKPSNFPFYTEISAKSIVIWDGITISADLISSGKIDPEKIVSNLTQTGYAIFIEKGIHIK